ncbi:MAG: hypothetical protein RQ966_00155 [Acetobacteraceae bacterium]|nr:hypothetical protein [Acetobacteraceae bacterium]
MPSRLGFVRVAAATTWLAIGATGLVGCAPQFGPANSGIPAPPPDYGACSGQRQRFYAVSQDAVSNERNRQSLEGASSAANSELGRLLTNSLASQIPSVGSLASSLGSMLQDLSASANQDTALIQDFAASFDGLVRCRRQEIAHLRRDLRARRITRPEATERASEIRSQALADAAVARDVNAQLSARAQRFQAAIADVDTRLGAEPVSSPRRAEVAQVRRTVQTNQKALVTQAATVDSSVRERAFDVISSLLPSAAVREA